jgi:5-formyltetrahydrofolate cyclo-ligase
MKGELRKKILNFRRNMSEIEAMNKSTKIAETLFDIPEFKCSRVIMLYIDFRNEVKTGEIIKLLLSQGKRVVIPITDIKNTKLIPSEIKEYPNDLVPGTWGIMEPKEDCIRPIKIEEIDFVVVPGVAFDTLGNRLGYGGGFYDRFLPQTKNGAVFAALAFELQIRDEVYPEVHDQRVHYVITEDRLIKTS